MTGLCGQPLIGMPVLRQVLVGMTIFRQLMIRTMAKMKVAGLDPGVAITWRIGEHPSLVGRQLFGVTATRHRLVRRMTGVLTRQRVVCARRSGNTQRNDQS
jgi:hypothetical protein